MEKAFEELVRILWQYGDAGRIICSIILVVDDLRIRTIIRASTVGVLEINNLNPQAFLDRAWERKKSQSAIATPFSPEIESGISNLITELGDKQYTLVIMHPSTGVKDIIISAGSRFDYTHWGYGTIVLSRRELPESIEYVVPKQHQKAA